MLFFPFPETVKLLPCICFLDLVLRVECNFTKWPVIAWQPKGSNGCKDQMWHYVYTPIFFFYVCAKLATVLYVKCFGVCHYALKHKFIDWVVNWLWSGPVPLGMVFEDRVQAGMMSKRQLFPCKHFVIIKLCASCDIVQADYSKGTGSDCGPVENDVRGTFAFA